jgi:hypothetical protein
MSISVFDYFVLESNNTELLKDIKEKIYEFAQSEVENSTRNKKILFAEDLCKLPEEEQTTDFHNNYYHVLIECSDTNVEVNTHGRRTNEFIYELMYELQRLMEDASYPLQKELIKSEMRASMDGGEYEFFINYTKDKDGNRFSYNEFVMQDIPLCDALKACGAFELNVGERWVGMEENFFVIMEKIAEEYKNDRTDMLFVMDNSHDEMNACYDPALVKVRINKNNGDYHLIGYLNQHVKYTEKGESLDLESYPLERIMSNFFEDQDIASIDDIYSVSAVDKVSMMSAVGHIYSTYGLTVHIVLGCELKQKMLVKKYL